MNFYLGLNAAGREFVSSMLAAANVPMYRSQSDDIVEPQSRSAEVRPAVREAEGARRQAKASGKGRLSPWANALQGLDLDHLLPKGIDAIARHGDRYVLVEFKRAG